MEYLGIRLLGQDETMLDEALAVLEFNAGEYPDSSSVHASLARAYLAKGDRNAAGGEARRSLDLNPENAQARGIFRKLGNAE